MSLAGSRFSSESAPRPFHHGIRGQGGTIFRAAFDSEGASHEQAAQIAVTLFADTAEPVPTSARVLLRHQPIQAEKLRPDRKVLGSATPPHLIIGRASSRTPRCQPGMAEASGKTLQLPADNHLAGSINAMHLKD
jgi:hypothetical protein